MPNQRTVNLIVLDGWGVSLKEAGNAIAAAATPNYDHFLRYYPVTTLNASGIAVGLSWQEPGNSEVGHMTIGTGRIVYQYLPRIINSIRDGSFFENKALLAAVKNVQKNNSQLHLIGLIGSGSVHSYVDHLYALLDLAKLYDISDKVRLHLFTDGRDSLPTEGAKFISQLQTRLEAQKTGQIATVIGRFFAMDRDLNWDRTEKAWNLMVKGEGKKVRDLVTELEESYERAVTDEYIEPLVAVDKSNQPKGLVRSGDSVIFFNYREDSARQLTKAFVLPKKVGFKAEKLNLQVVTLTQYSDKFPVKVAFPPPQLRNTLGEVIAAAGLKQMRLAETEKYAHVTYFFNGSQEQALAGESRSLVPSDDVVNFSDSPQMQAPEIARRWIEFYESGQYQFILVNFSNPDLLAHTGRFEATVQGIQAVDKQLGKILKLSQQNPNCFTLVTADHGNAERMLDPYSGEKLTEHTTNDVPFVLINPKLKKAKDDLELNQALRQSQGLLSDIAPTVLELLGLEVPEEMTGSSLLGVLGVKI